MLGFFKLNSSSLFHFIASSKNIQVIMMNEPFNFTVFNIIGINSHLDNYLSVSANIGLNALDHWIYAFCNKEKNIDGFDDLELL